MLKFKKFRHILPFVSFCSFFTVVLLPVVFICMPLFHGYGIWVVSVSACVSAVFALVLSVTVAKLAHAHNRYLQVLENTAAISAVFHGDDRYGNFYTLNADAFEGFPGIWRYMLNAADAFTVEEQAAAIYMSNWVDTVDLYSELLLDAGIANPGHVPDSKELRLFAVEAINRVNTAETAEPGSFT